MRRKVSIKLVCSLLLFVILPSDHDIAFAALGAKDPGVSCGYLESIGLATGEWKRQYGDVYGCSSPYKEFGSGYPLRNNMAYYVDGGRSAALKLKIILNVNNKRGKAAAHQQLLEAATLLAGAALSAELPDSTEKAVLEGLQGSAGIGGGSIQVVRIDWPTGNGYEVRVIIE